MAFCAGKPALLACAGPVADSLAVNAVAPVTHLVAMALATQQLWLVKTDRVTKVVHQFIALCDVVAVQAPDTVTPVLQVLKIRHHACHCWYRAWLFARRQLGWSELESNTVVTRDAAQWHQGKLV